MSDEVFLVLRACRDVHFDEQILSSEEQITFCAFATECNILHSILIVHNIQLRFVDTISTKNAYT